MSRPKVTDAIAELAAEWHGYAYRVGRAKARKLGAPPQWHEDLAQAAVEELLVCLPRFDPARSALKAWVCHRCRWATHDEYRRLVQRRGKPRVRSLPFEEDAAAAEDANGGKDRFEEVDAADAVRWLLSRLPARLAGVVRRYWFDDAPMHVIAAELGVSGSRISQMVAQANQQMAELLAADEGREAA